MKAAPRTILIAGVAAAWLSGCSVGPDYHEPTVAVPSNWSEPTGGGAQTRSSPAAAATAPAAAAAQLQQWWTRFDDPVLNSLIDRAIKANCDLRIAEARLRQSRAKRQAAAVDFWPTADASASYTRQRISENSAISSIASSVAGGPGTAGAAPGTGASSAGAGGAPTGGATSSLPPGFQLDYNLYQAGFDASWEIDVFGGKRRALEAASADLAASEESRRDTLVTLLAEVARNYVELRGLQQRLGINRQTTQSQQETVEITRQRFEASLAGELDVVQATALLAGTEAQASVLETSIEQTIHQLSVLLGQAPGALAAELSPPSPLRGGPPDVPVGLPAELLRRRPDIRRAERQLASATAQIGVEVAELFPKFSVTGNVGLQSDQADNWLSAGSRYWSYGPTVQWRLFDAGRVWAQIRVRNAAQEEALATYERTVLTSLQDVEDALAAYVKERRRLAALTQQVQADERALQIASDNYVHGVGSFLDVLDSQRSVYQAQDQFAQSEQSVCADVIALYKALGGGWAGFPARPAGGGLPWGSVFPSASQPAKRN